MSYDPYASFHPEVSVIPADKQRVFHDFAKASQESMGWGNHYGRSPRYPYIQLYPSAFEQMVKPLLAVDSVHKVIDVGCGGGDKLYAFHLLKPTAHITGVEYDPTLVACARYMCPFADVIHGDALAHDYSEYDLIYMYCPLSDPDLQAALQARVMMQMHDDAILAVALQAHRDPQTNYYFPDLSRGWIKGRSEYGKVYDFQGGA